MKINDILIESSENLDILDKVIQGEYFQTYLKPLIESAFKNSKKLSQNKIRSIMKKHDLEDKFIDYIFFHGTKDESKTNTISQFSYRTQPTDTADLIHNYTNRLAEDKLGEPIRNLFFVSKNPSAVAQYGRTHIFIPITHANFYYNNDINDFTNNIRTSNQALYHSDRMIFETGLRKDENIESIKEVATFLEHFIYNELDDLSDESLLEIHTEIKNLVNMRKLDKKYIDIIYEHIEYKFKTTRNRVESYIENVEHTKDPKEIGINPEIMVKAEQYALIDSAIFKNIGEEKPKTIGEGFVIYYINNYLGNDS